MVPYESKGSSFKGAGLYYLHDKKALTSERVGWTHTENLSTFDPERALREMTDVYYDRHYLQKEAGIPQTGRDVEKPVFAFSLSWHTEQNPTKEQMIEAGRQALQALKLHEHQTLFVCHNDTSHAHIHLIVNRVHPETGRCANLDYSKMKLSRWAEQYEKENGKIYCPERVKNNEKRRNGEYVRHNDTVIKNAWEHSDSGKAFVSALSYYGYTLAKGDRRDFIVVDNKGNVVNPVRHLDGVKTKEFRDRLSDIDRENLQSAGEVIHGIEKRREATEKGRDDFKKSARDKEPETFDRDAYNMEWEQKMADAGIREDKEKREKKKIKGKAVKGLEKVVKEGDYHDEKISADFLKEFDKKQELQDKADRQREDLKEKLDEQYKRKETEQALKNSRDRLKELENKGFRFLSRKEKETLQDRIETLEKNLADIRQKEAWETARFESQIDKEQSGSESRNYRKRKRRVWETPPREEKVFHERNKLDLRHLDEKRSFEFRAGQRREALKEKLEEQYKRKETENALREAKDKAQNIGFFGEIFKGRELGERIETLEKELTDIRKKEAWEETKLERQIGTEQSDLNSRHYREIENFERYYGLSSDDSVKLKEAFEKAETIEKQKAEGLEKSQDKGRERNLDMTIPPPRYRR